MVRNVKIIDLNMWLDKVVLIKKLFLLVELNGMWKCLRKLFYFVYNHRFSFFVVTLMPSSLFFRFFFHSRVSSRIFLSYFYASFAIKVVLVQLVLRTNFCGSASTLMILSLSAILAIFLLFIIF